MKSAGALGARERNKLERRERIKNAASEVFNEKGYQAATTQEIAFRAGVAIGTLFAYAPEKRDLLLMIVNDDLDVLTSRTFASITPGEALIDQLLVVYQTRYQYYGVNPRLSRQILHARVLESASREAGRLGFRHNAMISGLARMIRDHQEQGMIKDGDAVAFARLFHSIYLGELREWLSIAAPDVSNGMARLRAMLELAITGVGAPGAVAPAK